MGPNRQKRPTRKGTRFSKRRDDFMQRQHQNPSILSQESRDMIIDVLRHVASGGISIIDNHYFNPNSDKGVITLIKNHKLSPIEVLQLIFEKLGFPPNVVGEYIVDVIDKPEFKTDAGSVLQTLDPEKPYGDHVYDACVELFETMLWYGAVTGVGGKQGSSTLEDVASPTVEEQEEVNEEVEQIEMVFGDHFVEDISDEAEGGRELLYRFESADNVPVYISVTLGKYYPKDPPLVMFDSSEETLRKKKITIKSFSIPAPARRTILDAAVAAIQSGMGQCMLLSLIGSIQGAISELNLKPTATNKTAVVQDTSAITPIVTDKAKEAAQEKARFLESLNDHDKITSNGQRGAQSSFSITTSTTQNRTAMITNDIAPTSFSSTARNEQDKIEYTLPSKVELAITTPTTSTESRYHLSKKRTTSSKQDASLDAQLKDEWHMLNKIGELMGVRKSLPAFQVRHNLKELMETSNVVIISGETGSGKTTQIPQFLYEFMCEDNKGSLARIICTQPRRLAATSVAIRVAEERGETVGGTVGYSIRLENKVSARTRILYCTVGIVLRRLQSDPLLNQVSHIVVDEIHERGIDTDFLLILLKDLLERRKDIKVILMSATMDSMLFSRYFNNAPFVNVAGRTFPVDTAMLEQILPKINYVLEDGSPYALDTRGIQSRKEMRNINKPGQKGLMGTALEEAAEDKQIVDRVRTFMEFAPDHKTAETLSRMNFDVINYELVAEIVKYICRHFSHVDGAILIFMPGLAEISQCIEELKFTPDLRDVCIFYNLHSSLGSSQQRSVFQRAPRGKRKVIVGTNIMETSITIDDAVFVIDSGKVKENRYDPGKSLSQLITMWVSKANARQRSGRAGRVQPGYCFRLYTTPCFEQFEEHQLCEMHRVPLESLILQVYTLNLGDEVEFLSKALSPPETKAITSSVKVLSTMGALTMDKRLTTLGAHLANLPIDVRIGKMVIHGALLSCLDPVLTIAACISVRSPFIVSKEDRRVISNMMRSFAGEYRSDQMTAWFAYQKWAAILMMPKEEGGGDVAANAFCTRCFLSPSTLYQIQATKRQYEWFLIEAGFITLPKEELLRRKRNVEFAFKSYQTLDQFVSYEAGGRIYNVNSSNAKCILACFVSGLYPNVAKVLPLAKKGSNVIPQFNRNGSPLLKLATVDGSNVMLHPASVLAKEQDLRYPLVCYVDKVKTTATYLRETSMVSPFMVILFGAVDINYFEDYGEMLVDKLLCFKCAKEEALLLRHIKDQFEGALKTKINDPSVAWEDISKTVVKAILKLLQDEGSMSKSMVIIEKSGRKSLTAPLQPLANTQQQAVNKVASNLPLSLSEGQMFRTNKTCFNCGEVGHVSRFCPEPSPSKAPGAPSVRCFICNQWHHPMDCDIPTKE